MSIEAATNLFHQANAARERGDRKAAMRLLASSIVEDETLPGPWFNLASEFHNDGDKRAAVAALRRTTELSPEEVYSSTNLGWNLQMEGQYEEAIEHLEQAVLLRPDLPLGWSNLCLAYNAVHKADLAILAGRKAVECDTKDPQHHMALAFALMMDGQYAEGLKEYEWRFHYKMPEFLSYPIPLWRGEKVKKLFIPGEQGLGDMIQFARYLGLAAERADEVIVGVHTELFDLMDDYSSFEENVIFAEMPCVIPGADAFCPIMSLPVALGLSDAQVPAVDCYWLRDEAVEARAVPATERKKVGIVWAGSAEQDNDHNRSASIQDFLELYRAPGIQLYSFQVGDRAKECRPLNPLVFDLSPKIRNFVDTASFLKEMDVVVTVCTSVAHLAGTMGIRTHIVLPRRGQHFVWEHSGETTLWYDSVVLHRQAIAGDWASVLKQVSEVL